MELTQLKELYRTTLIDDVIPWWLRHGIDANGGINTCIRDDGSLISRDRWNWSQWRAVYVYSKLYNTIEPRQEWLDIARGIYKFVTTHGPLDDGHWPLLLDGDGMILQGYSSLYVDGFALYGLAELLRATGDEEVADHAMRTFEAVERALAHRLPPPAYPYPIAPGLINHGISMIFSLSYHELAEVTGDARVRAASDFHHRRVMEKFLHPDRGVTIEWLTTEGKDTDPPAGTACVPGHGIESMWFQIHIAQAKGDDATVKRAVEAIRTHLERGWDEKYGGLILAVDADGRDEVGWPHADTKVWWPQTEALYATLLAYEICREDWCLEWHEKVRQWSYEHYPVAEHGEWRQKLDRQGNEITETLCLPVKDPFHLPRALIYAVDVLERLT